jgi:hypothetical protein
MKCSNLDFNLNLALSSHYIRFLCTSRGGANVETMELFDHSSNCHIGSFVRTLILISADKAVSPNWSARRCI